MLKYRNHTEKILVLSTEHMPNADPYFGRYRVLKGEHEHIVVIGNLGTMQSADWFEPIVEWAKQEGCTYVCFDRDAEVAEGWLETYDW